MTTKTYIISEETLRQVLEDLNKCYSTPLLAMGPEARKQTVGDGTPDEWWSAAYDAAVKEWNTRHNAGIER